MKRIAPTDKPYQVGDVIDITKKVENPSNSKKPFMKRGMYLITEVGHDEDNNHRKCVAIAYGNQEKIAIDGKNTYNFYQRADDSTVEATDRVYLSAQVIGKMIKKEIIVFTEE